MSGLLGGGSTLGNQQPEAYSLPVQTSVEGRPIPLGWGTDRIPPNIIWAGDYQAISHDSSAGGKGGVASSAQSYTYQVSAMMALSEGSISGIGNGWVEKSKYTDICK